MTTKKYKAIIFDVDGTLVPSGHDSVPSAEVIAAIHAAHKHAFIGVATGRSSKHALPIMHTLDITNPSIIFGGAQIIDPVTGNTLWEKLLSTDQLTEIAKVFEKYKTEKSMTFEGDAEIDQVSRKVNTDKPLHGLSMIELNQDKVAEAHNEVSAIDGVTAHLMESWHSGTNVDISHAEADKEKGLLKLLEMNNMKPEDIIVVGDSSNDLPLFAAATGGFRVAMGNATDELKSLADYIAPSVYDDGAAHVIEKFIMP